MESLEAFERARDLPREALNHDCPINPFKAEIIQLKIKASTPHVWQGFNRSAVFLLSEDIVLKAQNQYYVPNVSMPGDRMLLELGLANFAGTQLERQVFAMLQLSPHPNLVRCLDAHSAEVPGSLDSIIFFERLDLLSASLVGSNMKRRRRWAIELASAFSHLEFLGLIPIKTYVRDLGLDKTGRLKLVGFGASPRNSHSGAQAQHTGQGPTTDAHHGFDEVTRENMASAHQRLASCLHYILSGVDPDEQAREMGHARHSQEDRIQWRQMVRCGGYPIAAGAEPISEVLQDAWALRTTASGEAKSFAEVERNIRDALGAFEVEDEADLQPASSIDYGLLQENCRERLKAQEQEPRWMGALEYEEAVREATAEYDA